MTVFQGRARRGSDEPADARIEPLDEQVSIAIDGASPVLLPYVDIEDVADRDYVLTLTDHTGSVFEISMLGRTHGQVLAEITKRRDELLERDLLLRGVDLQDTFPGKLLGEQGPLPVQLLLYRDQLVVVPERGTMFGVPFSFIEEVGWDQDLYQVSVDLDDGRVLIFGHLAKRSEEFVDELRRLLDALARRTAATLTALMPGVEASTIAALSHVMRDGRAAQQREIAAIDPSAWEVLERVVPGTDDLRASYQHLASLTPPGWAAFGVKAVLGEVDDAADPEATDRWYFCPLSRGGRPVNALAQEVASGSGHATYVFRLMDPARFASLEGDRLADEVRSSIRLLNRALLQLGFRREPLYLPEEELTGPHARYRVALRKLEHLRWARASLLGRAVHNAGWEARIQELIGQA